MLKGFTHTSFLALLMLVGLQMALQGCTLSDFRRSSQLDIRERELNAREQALVLRESMADRRAATLKALDEKLQGDANVESAVNYRLGQSLYWLQEARSNQCYAPTYAPPQFRKKTREVLVREAASQFIVDQAEFVTEAVEIPVNYQVKPEHPLAAEVEYETVIQKVEIKPAHDVIIEIDPQFTEKQVSAIKRPAHEIWQPCEGGDNEIQVGQYCVIEQEAELEWLNREVLTGKAAVIRDRKAATFQEIQVRRPLASYLEQLTEDDMLVRVETVEVHKLKTEPKAKRALLPSRSDLVEVEQLEQPARIEWQQVLCVDNVSQLKGFKLALADELAKRKMDGNPLVSAEDFQQALNQWQRSENLPLSWPYVSADSLKLLAVPLD